MGAGAGRVDRGVGEEAYTGTAGEDARGGAGEGAGSGFKGQEYKAGRAGACARQKVEWQEAEVEWQEYIVV